MPSGETTFLLQEEAIALALSGAHTEALKILDAALAEAGSDRVQADALRLTRARVLLARDAADDAGRAASELEKIAGEARPEAWRARLELARLSAREGKTAKAAALLQASLEEFRRFAEAQGGESASLAKVLSGEVGRLQAAAANSPSSEVRPGPQPPPDATDLIRLVEFGKRLAAETDPDEVLRTVLHEAIDLTGAERGFVALTTGEDLDFALAENLDRTDIEKPGFEVSRKLIRQVVDTRRSALLAVAELPPDHPASQSLRGLGIRSVACVPMVGPDGPLGALYLDRRTDSPGVGRGRERHLDLFAGQAAAALLNARSHREKRRALERAEEAIRRHRSESERRVRYHGLIGASAAMQEVYRALDRIVPSELPVLILGETGTGKDVVARLIHDQGPRREREFLAVNCASLPESLAESELFGHERGAFTGADRPRPGLFETAHGGTLLLDEVGDMSQRMQADLLRVLQTGEVRRIGARETMHVEVRVIAATHRDLAEDVKRGDFRQDLYFRLNVLSLRLPPLREHPEDIPLIAREIVERLAGNRTPPAISEEAVRALVVYPWPGNVRELENVLRRGLLFDTPTIQVHQLPQEIREPDRVPTRPGSLREAEERALRRAVEAAGGNKSAAARILGIDRKTLYAMLERLGLA